MEYIGNDKSEQIMTFDLNRIKNQWGEIRKFGLQLINGLGEDIVKFRTHDDLLYNILKQIAPINKDLKYSHNSIENSCKSVLSYFNTENGSTIKLFGFDGNEIELNHKERGPIEEFCETIIEMCGLPSDEYDRLLEYSRDDLREITNLISWYENKTIVKDLLYNNTSPRNHDEKKYFDFYKRCIDARVEIINYQLTDIIKQSINKAKEVKFGYATIITKDLPYKFALRRHTFDCENIDIVRHRLSEFYVPELKEYYSLYKNDKSEFYKKYFDRISIDKHFENIQK